MRSYHRGAKPTPTAERVRLVALSSLSRMPRTSSHVASGWGTPFVPRRRRALDTREAEAWSRPTGASLAMGRSGYSDIPPSGLGALMTAKESGAYKQYPATFVPHLGSGFTSNPANVGRIGQVSSLKGDKGGAEGVRAGRNGGVEHSSGEDARHREEESSPLIPRSADRRLPPQRTIPATSSRARRRRPFFQLI